MSTTSFSAREAGIGYPEGVVVTTTTPAIMAPEQGVTPDELLQAVRSIAPGSFMLDRRFLPGLSDLAERAQFIEVEGREATRTESAHETVFGQLLLYSADEGEQSLHVAVKPFDTVQEAAHEYSVASHFANDNVPGITTYRPLGVYRLPDTEQFGVISQYRHSVRSLDNTLWNPDALANGPMVSKALGRAAVSLRSLHDASWTHGDASAKNFAWDILQPSQTSFFIDVEGAMPFQQLDGPEAVNRSVREDLETFLASLLMVSERPDGFDDLVKQHFCLVYAGKRQTYIGEAKEYEAIVLPGFDEMVAMYESQKQLDELHT